MKPQTHIEITAPLIPAPEAALLKAGEASSYHTYWGDVQRDNGIALQAPLSFNVYQMVMARGPDLL